MVRYSDEKIEAIGSALALGTDEGRKRAVKLWHDYGKATAQIKTYPARRRRAANSIEVEEDEGKVYALNPHWKSKQTWQCTSSNCTATYTGLVLSDGRFYGWRRAEHSHGSVGFPSSHYNASGRLKVLDRLAEIDEGDEEELETYKTALAKVEDVLRDATKTKKATAYIVLGGDLLGWSARDVNSVVGYLGQTSGKGGLADRMQQHARPEENLRPFTAHGPIFCVISIQVSEGAKHIWERLFIRLFDYTPRLINQVAGPVDLPGLTVEEVEKAAALKFTKAITHGDVALFDWRKRVAALERDEADETRSSTSSLDETDPRWGEYAALKAEERELEERLQATRVKKSDLKREASALRHACKRRKMEEPSEML